MGTTVYHNNQASGSMAYHEHTQDVFRRIGCDLSSYLILNSLGYRGQTYSVTRLAW